MDKIKVIKLGTFKNVGSDDDAAMEKTVNEFCFQHDGKIKAIRPILRNIYMIHYSD